MDMATIKDLIALEKRAKSHRISIARICRRAEVNHTNWNRWKLGLMSPRDATWERVQRAAEELIAERGAGRAA